MEVGEALKFIKGVRDLLEAKFDQFNSKMTRHQDKVFTALSDATAKFTVVLACTGDQAISVQNPFEELLGEMNSPTEVMSLRVLRQAICIQLWSGPVGDAVDLEIMLHNWGLVKEPYVAYGQVAVADIATWGQYGTRLTSKNLPQFKGLRRSMNRSPRRYSPIQKSFGISTTGSQFFAIESARSPLAGPVMKSAR